MEELSRYGKMYRVLHLAKEDMDNALQSAVFATPLTGRPRNGHVLYKGGVGILAVVASGSLERHKRLLKRLKEFQQCLLL
jgi:hypothetical protein